MQENNNDLQGIYVNIDFTGGTMAISHFLGDLQALYLCRPAMLVNKNALYKGYISHYKVFIGPTKFIYFRKLFTNFPLKKDY